MKFGMMLWGFAARAVAASSASSDAVSIWE